MAPPCWNPISRLGQQTLFHRVSEGEKKQKKNVWTAGKVVHIMLTIFTIMLKKSYYYAQKHFPGSLIYYVK